MSPGTAQPVPFMFLYNPSPPSTTFPEAHRWSLNVSQLVRGTEPVLVNLQLSCLCPQSTGSILESMLLPYPIGLCLWVVCLLHPIRICPRTLSCSCPRSPAPSPASRLSVQHWAFPALAPPGRYVAVAQPSSGCRPSLSQQCHPLASLSPPLPASPALWAESA